MSIVIKTLCCLAYLMNIALVVAIVFFVCALLPDIFVMMACILGGMMALAKLNVPINEIWKNTTERSKP